MAGKKKKNELFDMDDGDTSEVAGGLNEAPEFEDVPDEEIEFIDHVELDEEPAVVEPVEVIPDAEPAKEVEVKPEVKIDPAVEQFNNLVAIIAKKDEQLEKLFDKFQALTERNLQPAKEVEAVEPKKAPEPPNPDEMEWNEYVDAKFKYSEELKAYEDGIKQNEDERSKAIETEKLSSIQAIHTKDFADEAEDIPALKDNAIIRNKWAEIYYDPKNAFNTKPDGVFRTTRALKVLAKKDGIDLYNFGTPKVVKEPAITPEKLKADEAARLARVDTGSMTGVSTVSNKDTKLTAGMLDAAQKMGVTPEAFLKVYNQTHAALGGK